MDVMGTTIVWNKLRGNGGGESAEIERTGAEDVNTSDGKNVGNERVGPDICYGKKSSVHVDAEAFVNMSDGNSIGEERVGSII